MFRLFRVSLLKVPRNPGKGGKGKKGLDAMMNDIFVESMAKKDKGENPDMEFVHRRAQERVYEDQTGQKPPTQDDTNRKMFPAEPIVGLRRLVPLEQTFDNDPWPMLRERPLFPADPLSEFTDASDEYTFYELEYFQFLRENSVRLRRTLPLLHEAWSALSHRLLAAETRYIAARNKVLGTKTVEPPVFAATEERVKEVRMVCAESYKAHYSNSSYDPVMIRGTRSGPVIKMSKGDYAEFAKKLSSGRAAAAAMIL